MPVAVFNGPSITTYYVKNVTVTADTWHYKTITISGATSETFGSTNTAGLYLSIGAAGSAAHQAASAEIWLTGGDVKEYLSNSLNIFGTNGATLQITGVQLEEGTVATPFEHRPIWMEQSLCERYWRWGKFKLGGRATTGSGNRDNIFFSTTMRVHPTVTLFNETKNGIGTTFPEIGSPNHFTVYWLGSTSTDHTTYYGEYSADAEL